MTTLVQNKKAFHEYNILDEYVAGIQLMGTEVKSIREGKASISEAYCHIRENEIFILGMHISEYKQIKHTNHEPLRERKLLLHKKEIVKLSKGAKEKGLTIIPLGIYLTQTGFIKIKLGLAKGKKLYDKKNSIKLRDMDRDLKKSKIL